MLSEGGGRSRQPTLHRCIAERCARQRLNADDGVLDVLEVAARQQLGVVLYAAGVGHSGGGHPGRQQRLDHFRAIARSEPGAKFGVDPILRFPPSRVRCEGSFIGPGRSAQHLLEPFPLRVGLDRERQPSIANAELVTFARIEPLRCRMRRAVAFPLHQPSVGRELDQLFRSRLERALDHGAFDVGAAASLLATLERHQQREGAVHAGQGIAGPALDARLVVAVAREPRHPRHLLHRLGESRLVAPGARQPEGRHLHEDRARIGGPDGIPGDAEAFENPRREVLDDDVRLGHQLEQQLTAALGGEVDGHVLLVGVYRQEQVAALPPGVGVLADQHATHHAHAVGLHGSLDVDHLGPEQRAHLAGRRPRPPVGEVQDLQTVQRQARRTVGCRKLAGARLDVAVIGPDPRGRPEGRGILIVDAIGRTRMAEASGGIRLEHATARQLLILEHGLPVVDGGHRDPQQRCLLEDLGRRVFARPFVDDFVPLVEAPHPTSDLGQHLVLLQVDAIDHHQEVRELLTRVGTEAHIAVGSRLDRGRLDAGRERIANFGPHQLEEQVQEIRAGERHHFHQREVDVLTVSRAQRALDGGQRSHGRIRSGHPVRDAAAGHVGLLTRNATATNRAAGRLDRELGGRMLGPGSSPPEG